MIARVLAPFSIISGKTVSPDQQAAASAVVAMPDTNGRTLLRSYVVPLNPQTSAQIAIRSDLTSISEAYQSLTQAQADAWKAIAAFITRTGRLGLDYTLSWTALFQSVNSYRLQDGQSIAMNPPTFDSCNVPSGIESIVSDDGDPSQQVDLTLTESSTPTTGSKIAIRYTRDLGNAVRQARQTDFRYPAAPVDCILPRDVAAPYAYQITSTRLNILADTHIGVQLMVLTPNYYPQQRLTFGNVVVQSV